MDLTTGRIKALVTVLVPFFFFFGIFAFSLLMIFFLTNTVDEINIPKDKLSFISRAFFERSLIPSALPSYILYTYLVLCMIAFFTAGRKRLQVVCSVTPVFLFWLFLAFWVSILIMAIRDIRFGRIDSLWPGNIHLSLAEEILVLFLAFGGYYLSFVMKERYDLAYLFSFIVFVAALFSTHSMEIYAKTVLGSCLPGSYPSGLLIVIAFSIVWGVTAFLLKATELFDEGRDSGFGISYLLGLWSLVLLLYCNYRMLALSFCACIRIYPYEELPQADYAVVTTAFCCLWLSIAAIAVKRSIPAWRLR